MITEQQRQWAENVIVCLWAKLEGKQIQWQTPGGLWGDMEADDWFFDPRHTYRIAPEPPQEKKQLWVRMGNPNYTYNTLEEAQRNWPTSLIYQLTETARIEPEPPKGREPRRIWVNRRNCGWGIAFGTAAGAMQAQDGLCIETAVEFVEVIK